MSEKHEGSSLRSLFSFSNDFPAFPMVRQEHNSRAGNLPQNRNPKEHELSVLAMQLLCCHNISVFHFDNGESICLSKGRNDILHFRSEKVVNITLKSKL